MKQVNWVLTEKASNNLKRKAEKEKVSQNECVNKMLEEMDEEAGN